MLNGNSTSHFSGLSSTISDISLLLTSSPSAPEFDGTSIRPPVRSPSSGGRRIESFHPVQNYVRFFEQLPVRPVREHTGKAAELKWSAVRKIALARDFYRCRRCSSHETDLLTIHHIFPRRVGGGNDPGNLVTLCESCHQGLCRHCSRPGPLRVPLGESAFTAPKNREMTETARPELPADVSCTI